LTTSATHGLSAGACAKKAWNFFLGGREWRKYYENKVRNKDIIPVIIEDSYIPVCLDECETIDARSDETVCLLVHVQKKHGISFWEEAMDMHHVSTLKTAPTICPVCK
jgi:hypothetical protein